MSVRWITCLIVSALTLASCAERRAPEPANVAPGTPHVSWVLMFGDRDTPDREFACQSDPESECVVEIAPSDEQTFADLHFYFHGAGDETRYEGTMLIGFLQEAHESPTNITVKKNEAITKQSTIGLVTTQPGVYSVTLNLTGTVSDTGKRQPVRESFQVRVR